MTPVETALRQLIALDGPQNLERVMGLANGYYYANRDPFGEKGDFITAPEISQMFGEMVGIWLYAVWEKAGKPQAVNLVELGPGRGTLMDDVLRTLTRLAPDFMQSISVHLVESSPHLQNLQKQRLSHYNCPLTWHNHTEEIPAGFTLLVANEFLDALPVRQFIRKQDGWHEKCVTLQDDALAFALRPSLSPESLLPNSFQSAPVDACAEIAPAATSTVQFLARHIATQGGAALLIDYGYTRTQTGETLQALQQHKPVPVLANLGEADLTAHVDFEATAATAFAQGASVQGPVTQSAFLLQLGMGQRAQQLAAKADPTQQHTISSAFSRLTDTSSATGMGNLFKALCIHHPSLPHPAGFFTQEG